MSNELEVKNENLPVSADFLNEIAHDSQGGNGFENITKDDVAIPFLSILQALSPQLRGETKVKGAEEGDLFNTVSNSVVKRPCRIIPCAYNKAWVEWKPRDSGGGLVAQHQTEDILKQTQKGDKNQDVLPNGNIIVTTAYHYCLLVNEDNSFERIVMSLTSTQLKKSRRWNSQMMALMIDVNGKKIRPPMFSHIYSCSTVVEQKDKNSWYGWNIGSPELIKDGNLYAAAKAFHSEVTKGQVKIQEIAPQDDLPVSDNSADHNVL